MFFIFGFSEGQKELEYTKTMICGACGRYGRYRVFLIYNYFSLFFIPIFKWGRKYIVQTACCGKTYLLDKEAGEKIRRREAVEIRPEDLTAYGSSGVYEKESYDQTCPVCGAGVSKDFSFCPSCGSDLKKK